MVGSGWRRWLLDYALSGAVIWFAVRVNLVCTFACMLFPFRLQVGTDGFEIKFPTMSCALEDVTMLQRLISGAKPEHKVFHFESFCFLCSRAKLEQERLFELL